MSAVTVYKPRAAKIEWDAPRSRSDRQSRRRRPPAGIVALSNPVVAVRRSTRAFRAPPSAKRRGAGASHHRSVIRRSNGPDCDNEGAAFEFAFGLETLGRAVVVHAADGTRVACGVLGLGLPTPAPSTAAPTPASPAPNAAPTVAPTTAAPTTRTAAPTAPSETAYEAAMGPYPGYDGPLDVSGAVTFTVQRYPAAADRQTATIGT